MRRLFPTLAVVLLSAGCVPVTRPVGDIEKAQVDKDMVGLWTDVGNKKGVLKIEAAPAVRGNPKGLMRMTDTDSKKDEIVYFFVTTVGKEKYGNICLDAEDKKGALDLSKAGAYKKWVEGKKQVYFVFRYNTNQNELTINFGDEKAFKAIAQDAKLPLKFDIVYDAPAGWLQKYLEKNGSEKIFPAGKADKLTRVKK